MKKPFQALYSFSEGDDVIVRAVQAGDARRRFYESFGITSGARIRIFLVSGKKVILLAGKSKLALSPPASEEILAERA